MKKVRFLLVLLIITLVSSVGLASELEELVQKTADYYGFSIFGTATSDFNADGNEDMAVIFCKPAYLWTEETEGEGEAENTSGTGTTPERTELPPAILYNGTADLFEEPCIWVVTLEGGQIRVLSHISSGILGPEDGGIRGLDCDVSADGAYLTYYAGGGSNWIWGDETTWKYKNGEFTPVAFAHSWSFLGLCGDDISTNNETYRATFEYYRQPVMGEEEGDEECYSDFVEFYRFLPGSADKILVDGMMEPAWIGVPKVSIEQDPAMLTYGAERWQGPEDLALSVQTILQGTDLYIYLVVTDDSVVFAEKDGLKQDHLEIWLDSLPNLEDEDVDIDFDKYAGLGLYRHTKKGLYQFALYTSGAMQYLPKTQKESAIKYVLTKTQSGYVAEIKLPLANYLTANFEEYTHIGLTIVASDTDNKDKPAQDTLLATSSLRWGDPFTLGWLILQPADE